MNADEITGKRIYDLMRDRGLTQAALGQAIGLSQVAAGRKLSGVRGWTLDELLAAARFLNVEVTALMPGDDYAPVLSGRGRSVEGVVRLKGLEPLTF